MGHSFFFCYSSYSAEGNRQNILTIIIVLLNKTEESPFKILVNFIANANLKGNCRQIISVPYMIELLLKSSLEYHSPVFEA